MDKAGDDSPIEPVARISDERLKRAVTILKRAEHERSPARERLGALAQEWDRLLGEIEQFRRVVYCGRAAACLLDNGVLRVLAGSALYAEGKLSKIRNDVFWNRPSPAAVSALGRSANGLEEWKDRTRRSINAIYKIRAEEAKKPGKVSEGPSGPGDL